MRKHVIPLNSASQDAPIWVRHLNAHFQLAQRRALAARAKAEKLNEVALQAEIALRIAERAA